MQRMNMSTHTWRLTLLAILICALPSLFGQEQASTAAPGKKRTAASVGLPPAAASAMKSIDPQKIREHVRFLSHDLLEGRGTGQRGGDIAAQYIATQLALYGLKPAGGDGSFLQKVPLVGITTQPETTFSIAGERGETKLKYADEYVAYDETQQPASDIDADIVFVGYSVEAPEYK